MFWTTCWPINFRSICSLLLLFYKSSNFVFNLSLTQWNANDFIMIFFQNVNIYSYIYVKFCFIFKLVFNSTTFWALFTIINLLTLICYEFSFDFKFYDQSHLQAWLTNFPFSSCFEKLSMLFSSIVSNSFFVVFSLESKHRKNVESSC